MESSSTRESAGPATDGKPIRQPLGRRVPTVLLALFALVFLASLPNRLPHLDDAWLGEQAWWLAREGVVRSELFRGILDHDERIWVFHKLFITQGALAVKLCGWSLPAIKAVSLPWFALVLALLVVHVRSWPERFGRYGERIAALLLIAHPLVVDYAYTFRPEMCLMAIGFASYLLLRRYLATGRVLPLAAGASLAGLAVLVHLHGVVLVAAGAAMLFVERKRVAAGVVVVVGLAIGALYGLDAFLAGELDALRMQFAHDTALDGGGLSASGMLARLLAEPERFFRHGEDVVTSLLVIVAVAVLGKRLFREERMLGVYTLVAAVTLALVSQSKMMKYMLAYLPQLVLLATAALHHSRRSRPILVFVVSGFLVVCLGRSVRYFARNYDSVARHEQLVADLDPSALLLADLTFVFDELPNRPLRGLWGYQFEPEAEGRELRLAELLERARADGVRYVVLDQRRILPRDLAAEWPEPGGFPGVKRLPGEEALVLELDPQGPAQE